jgi:hypothetical protein
MTECRCNNRRTTTDDEIKDGNSTPHLHVGELYTTKYDNCCGR